MMAPETLPPVDPVFTRYTTMLLETLGDRPWLEVMSEQLSSLHRLVDGVSEDVLRTAEAPGKWSVVQVVAHLADSELVQGYRSRMVLAHEGPELQAYDQDRWAAGLRYENERMSDVLEDLRAMRTRNLRLWGRLTPEELSRYGVHRERGRESLLFMLKLTAGHDLHHLRQVRRVLGIETGDGRRETGV